MKKEQGFIAVMMINAVQCRLRLFLMLTPIIMMIQFKYSSSLKIRILVCLLSGLMWYLDKVCFNEPRDGGDRSNYFIGLLVYHNFNILMGDSNETLLSLYCVSFALERIYLNTPALVQYLLNFEVQDYIFTIALFHFIRKQHFYIFLAAYLVAALLLTHLSFFQNQDTSLIFFNYFSMLVGWKCFKQTVYYIEEYKTPSSKVYVKKLFQLFMGATLLFSKFNQVAFCLTEKNNYTLGYLSAMVFYFLFLEIDYEDSYIEPTWIDPYIFHLLRSETVYYSKTDLQTNPVFNFIPEFVHKTPVVIEKQPQKKRSKESPKDQARSKEAQSDQSEPKSPSTQNPGDSLAEDELLTCSASPPARCFQHVYTVVAIMLPLLDNIPGTDGNKQASLAVLFIVTVADPLVFIPFNSIGLPVRPKIREDNLREQEQLGRQPGLLPPLLLRPEPGPREALGGVERGLPVPGHLPALEAGHQGLAPVPLGHPPCTI
jgi:hypothetical protein